MDQIGFGPLSQPGELEYVVNFMRPHLQLYRQEVGNGWLLAPDERACLFEIKLPAILGIKERQRSGGSEFGGLDSLEFAF